MIRINLLPYRPAQRLRTLNRILLTWAATVVLGLLLLFGADLLILDEIQTLTSQKNRNDQTIAELNEKLGEIKEINDRKALALTRLDIINRLSNEQTISIHVLDELTHTIPDQVWLTRMEIQKNLLTLTGLSSSSAVVADFMRQLSRSPYFANIELSKVAQQEQKEQKERKNAIQSFSLSLQFALPKPSTPAPAPAPAANGQAATADRGK
ncbi:MAG: PilN domain-containing protein [Magnetococcales bacterium]|nr:PilN domain-containing protein [Magnetococcales bacterium]